MGLRLVFADGNPVAACFARPSEVKRYGSGLSVRLLNFFARQLLPTVPVDGGRHRVAVLPLRVSVRCMW